VGDAVRAIREHHRQIRDALRQRVAAALDRGARDDLNALVALLEGDLLGHARAEQQHLYPLMDELVREHGRATATMDIDHEAIADAVGRVAVAVERLRVARERQDRMTVRSELREALLRLDTLLDVHLDKEERVYLPLLEEHVSPESQASLIARMSESPPPREGSTDNHIEVDVRRIPQRERHRKIFEQFEQLPVGASLELVSDHDPRPLSYQFAADHADAYTWTYVERGAVWRVRITRTRPG